MIVEDEVILGMLTKQQLEKEGYHVVVATSGEKAVDLVCEKKESVDLIIMDIDLGKGIDGTEAAQEILKLYDIPLLFLSSHTEKDIVERTEQITNYGYVVKNSSFTVLDASIKMAFKLFNAQQNIRSQRMDIEAAYEEMQVANEELIDTQHELTQSEKRHRLLFTEMQEGFALHETICDEKGYPIDYRFLEINNAFEKLTGLNKSDIIGKTVLQVLPGTESVWIEKYGHVALTGEPIGFENYSAALKRYYQVSVFCPQKGQFAVFFMDITNRKNLEESLTRSHDDLIESQHLAKLGSWRLDTRSNEVIWSEELYKMYGFDSTKPPPPFAEHQKLFTPEGWSLLSAALAKTAETGVPYELELKTIRKDKNTGWMWVYGKTLADAHGVTVGLFGAAQDITERKKIEETYRIANNRHEAMIANIGDVIGIIGTDGIMKYKSPNIEKWFGWKPEDLVGSDGWHTVHPDDLDRIKKLFISLLEKEKSQQTVEYRYKCKDGTYKWIELTAVNCVNDNIINGILLNYHDISERRKAEQLLKESEQIFYEMFEKAPLGYQSLDIEGFFIEINQSWLDTLGYSRNDVIGKWFGDFLALEFVEPFRERFQIFKKLGVIHSEFYMRHKDGSLRYIEFDGRIGNNADGSFKQTHCILKDGTERKIAQGKILDLLREKELILKEIHHRIKNNMNTIYGLLSLQAKNMENTEAKVVLMDAAGRVQSMLHLYNKIYKSENITAFTVKEYLPALINEIVGIFSQKVLVSFEMEDIILNVTVLSPLGIILNELITNSMKYAFDGIDTPAISVYVTKKGGMIRIIYQDNGIGIPESCTLENSKGFGMQLISMLVRQLQGTVCIERGIGTKFVIDFEVNHG